MNLYLLQSAIASPFVTVEPTAISPEAVTVLIGTFTGGFLMTWLRGFRWFGEGYTYSLALAGGALATGMIGATRWEEWMFGIMTNTLVVLGAVMAGGGLAKARAATDIPAAVLPKFNELSK